MVVPHEMRHWQDMALFDITHPRDWNFFAHVSLLLFDELAALVAGRLLYMRGQQMNLDSKTISNAILNEYKHYISSGYYDKYRDCFINDSMETLRYGVKKDARFRNQQKDLLSLYNTNPDAVFDTKFHDTVAEFFTFGDHCIFKDTETKNRNVRARIEKLMSQTRQNVSSLIAQEMKAVLK